jgi:hypothetical protein
MRATHRGGSVIIEVSDDGRGLDRERIIAKARELSMPVEDSWTDVQVWDLIFEAGFSTAKEVTNLSGRGVGMDVVRRNIASLGGAVSISSRRGEGTTITIQLPLTLAVLDGMIVGVGDEQYIVPLEFVAEAIMPAAADIKTVVNQASLVAVRGEHLPIVRLEDVVQLERDAQRPARAALPRGGGRQPARRAHGRQARGPAAAGGEVARDQPALGAGSRRRHHPGRRARLPHPRRELAHAHDREPRRGRARHRMSAATDTREFPFSSEHFRLISDRMYQFSGIRLPEAKREMVYARLARRLRSLGSRRSTTTCASSSSSPPSGSTAPTRSPPT